MTRTEFPPAIKSRPVYGVLAPRPGALHLIVIIGIKGNQRMQVAITGVEYIGNTEIEFA